MFAFHDQDADVREAADAVTSHALLNPLADGRLISQKCCEEVCGLVDEFLTKLRTYEGDDERYWKGIQKLWGFANPEIAPKDQVTPMNAVNLCPEPEALLKAANRLRLEYNLDVSQQKRMVGSDGQPGQRVRELRLARKVLAEGLRLKDHDELAILRNASEGNNAINCGYRNWLRTDDPNLRENVVIWRENHPTNNEAWWLRAQWESRDNPLFDVRAVDFLVDEAEADIARAFIDRIDDRTRFVSFTEISNGNGMRIPESVIRRIWNHINDNHLDCHLHIDGTMSFGSRPVDLSDPHCHSFISSAHKWFIGPKETGILYMRSDKAKNFMPSIFAYDYQITVPTHWDQMPPNALRFEYIGQRDDVNIITLALTQLMWTALQPRNPYKRVVQLTQRLMKKLANDGWELVTPIGSERSWGIVRVLAPKGRRTHNLYNWMYADTNGPRIGGSGDDKTYRLSPHIYNTIDDVDAAVGRMEKWREG